MYRTFFLLAAAPTCLTSTLHTNKKPFLKSPFETLTPDIQTLVYDDKSFTSKLTPKQVFGPSRRAPKTENLRASASLDFVNSYNLVYYSNLYMGTSH